MNVTEPHDLRELVLRPVALSDLAALERIAAASAHGIGSLPHDREQLRQRIAHSIESFASADDASGEERYLFVLEDLTRAQVVGCSGIAASAGFHDRFYSYRNEFVVHASAALGVSRRLHTLHLCHDLTGYTLLTSFYIDPAYADGPAPQLLSRARLLFILRHLERFNDRIAAESPGLADEAGQSPFWDAVGRRFFDMDYPQAEAVTGGRSKSFIADLMPQSPIYVPLLPEAAQFAIGQLHPVGELPFSILQDEGFDADSYIDIFDGGPTVEASLHLLRSVRHARELAVQADAMALGQPVWHLAVNSARPGFRAVLAELPPAAQALAPGHEAVQRLGLSEGHSLWVTPLQPDALERSRS
ncbi:arginine N-succinyltransferase [Paucibacter sp. DJ2R-2]|uniref:arginine N-succinyltransferase n=1 Tax=Paucibacter sp. DJ2R-2 TaxID=2893558 RepID=UPI0021E3AD23|nr:arginine N-succinyltransferase [Paucibacter sp. DJ2R-2]MCV2422288.1 arginine N-succinyltransferase [Paucibacter sp. DJ4R-1]MCV2440128.1 arginine N-succinyltransferase [Paucibacter sp. DJ2R-2]